MTKELNDLLDDFDKNELRLDDALESAFALGMGADVFNELKRRDNQVEILRSFIRTYQLSSLYDDFVLKNSD